MKYIELWHGGKDLEYDYREFKGTRKNRWEHGPGLYLTTHYDRARQYAKGRGNTYLVSVEEGNDIEKTLIDISMVNDFISKHIIRSKQKEIMEDIYENMRRMNTEPKVYASVILNLIINLEAISNTKTKLLNSFLVENGVDYGFVKNYSGRDENVMIIFNRDKIKSVKSIPAKEVSVQDYVKPFIFKEVEKKLKI